MRSKDNNNLFPYLIISIVLHIAALMAVVLNAKPKPVFVSAPIDVAFYTPSEKRVDPPPVAQVVEKQPEPEPVKEEIKEEPKTPDDIVVKKKEKPKPKPQPKPKPKPAPKKEEPPKTEEKPIPPSYNDVQTLQPAASTEPKYAAVGVGAQYEGLAYDTANFKYAYYTNTIINKMRRTWQWAESYGKLRAVVYFKILKDGSVTSVIVKEPSGDAGFDQNAIRAIQLAVPFAPLPDGYAGDSLGVYFEFKFRN